MPLLIQILVCGLIAGGFPATPQHQNNFQQVMEYVKDDHFLLESAARIGKYDDGHFNAENSPPRSSYAPKFRASPFIRQNNKGDWEAAVPMSQYLAYVRSGGKPDGSLSPFETTVLALPEPGLAGPVLPGLVHSLVEKQQSPGFPYSSVLPAWRRGKLVLPGHEADAEHLADLLSSEDSPDADGFHHRVFHSEADARAWVMAVSGADRDFEEIPPAVYPAQTQGPLSFDSAGLVAEELDRSAGVASGTPRGPLFTEEARHKLEFLRTLPKWTESHKQHLREEQQTAEAAALDTLLHQRARRPAAAPAVAGNLVLPKLPI